MKSLVPFLQGRAAAIIAGGGLVVLTGCAGVTPSAQTKARIEEKGAVYTTLKPEQQENILGGAIERGNTADMVYMALGKPKKIVTSADGVKAMWIYEEFYQVKGPAKFGMNTAHTARQGGYSSQVVLSANTPFWPGGLDDPAFSAVAPQKFGVATSSFTQSLDLPDLQSKTVYVFFFAGKVAEIKLDGDSSDQKTASPNAVTKPGV